MGEIMCSNSRGRSPGKWRDRVKENICERGATRRGDLNQAKREYLAWTGRGGEFSAVVTPLRDTPRGNKVSEL